MNRRQLIDGTVYGSDAASGRVVTGRDIQLKPWNLRWEGYRAPAATSEDARRERSLAALIAKPRV